MAALQESYPYDCESGEEQDGGLFRAASLLEPGVLDSFVDRAGLPEPEPTPEPAQHDAAIALTGSDVEQPTPDVDQAEPRGEALTEPTGPSTPDVIAAPTNIRNRLRYSWLGRVAGLPGVILRHALETGERRATRQQLQRDTRIRLETYRIEPSLEQQIRALEATPRDAEPTTPALTPPDWLNDLLDAAPYLPATPATDVTPPSARELAGWRNVPEEHGSVPEHDAKEVVTVGTGTYIKQRRAEYGPDDSVASDLEYMTAQGYIVATYGATPAEIEASLEALHAVGRTAKKITEQGARPLTRAANE